MLDKEKIKELVNSSNKNSTPEKALKYMYENITSDDIFRYIIDKIKNPDGGIIKIPINGLYPICMAMINDWCDQPYVYSDDNFEENERCFPEYPGEMVDSKKAKALLQYNVSPHKEIYDRYKAEENTNLWYGRLVTWMAETLNPGKKVEPLGMIYLPKNDDPYGILVVDNLDGVEKLFERE